MTVQSLWRKGCRARQRHRAGHAAARLAIRMLALPTAGTGRLRAGRRISSVITKDW